MAILRIKKLIEDLENNTTLVLGNVNKVAQTAGIAATATLAVFATSSGNSGTALKATSAGQAGTSYIALYGSAGTGALP